MINRTFLLLLVGGTLALVAGGCNTIKGLGTDVHDMAQNTQVWLENGTNSQTDARTPSPNSPSRSINRTAAYQQP
jgi:predicted small secreted protein